MVLLIAAGPDRSAYMSGRGTGLLESIDTRKGRIVELRFCMFASSGMTFSFVPACSTPVVTTADSLAAISQKTMVCRLITVAVAITTGSMLGSGEKAALLESNNTVDPDSQSSIMGTDQE
jgi:hypothetical protein